MKFVQRICIIIIACCMLSGAVSAAPTVLDIMKEMDDMENLGSDVTLKVKITQQRVEEGVKVLESVFYRRDVDDAFLLIMTAPDSDKGNGYLRVGDNMWMYRRNTRTFQIMNRDEPIGGTGAKAGDMEKKKFSELYEPVLDAKGKEILSEETLGKAKIPCVPFSKSQQRSKT